MIGLQTHGLKKTNEEGIGIFGFAVSDIFSAKSEGRRTIRFRMGHDTSSKQHNIS